MKRFSCVLTLWLLLALPASAQIIGGGIIGGGGDLIAKASPTSKFDGSQLVYTDAAIQFTAADKSWLQIADASQTGLDPGTDDSIWMAWVKVDSLAANIYLVNKSSVLTVNLSSNGSVTTYFGPTATQTTTDAGVITAGTWKFLAIFADRSDKIHIYINGVDVKSADISAAVATNINSTSAFVLGATSSGGAGHSGSVDSLMVFSAADLSTVASDIIAWAYNSGSGRLCSDISASQKTPWGAVSGWELGEASGTRYDSWGSNDLSQSFAEMTTNGTFTGNATGWSLGANWAYGTNDIAATAADADVTQALTATAGKLYTISYAVGGPTGSVRFEFGGVDGTTRSTAATHSETVRAVAAGTNIAISPVAAFSGRIDTVSAKAAEILPAPGIVRGLAIHDDDVSYWQSLTGSVAAEIETLAKRPAYDTTTNAFAVLDADGVDDYHETSLVGGDAGTAILVLKNGATGDVYMGMSEGTETIYIKNVAGVITAGAGNTPTALTSNEDPTTGYRVVVFVWGGNGAAQFLMVDGTVEDTETQNAEITVTQPFYLFAENDDGTAKNFAEASIAYAITSNTAISQSHALGITKRLQNSLGLSP